MAMFENFPYTDMHNLNLDWIIKIAKDFLDQYTHIQQLISDGETSLQNLTEEGLQQLQEKADNLEAVLQEWYNTHSEDIANELADALNDLNDWYTLHQNYLDQTLVNKINQFNQAAEAKAAEVIASIPADYTELNDQVDGLEERLDFRTAYKPAVNIQTGLLQYVLTPALVPHSTLGWHISVFVEEGDILDISGFVYDASAYPLFFTYDNVGNLIESAYTLGETTTGAINHYKYNVPKNAWVVYINGSTNSGSEGTPKAAYYPVVKDKVKELQVADNIGIGVNVDVTPEATGKVISKALNENATLGKHCMLSVNPWDKYLISGFVYSADYPLIIFAKGIVPKAYYYTTTGAHYNEPITIPEYVDTMYINTNGDTNPENGGARALRVVTDIVNDAVNNGVEWVEVNATPNPGNIGAYGTLQNVRGLYYTIPVSGDEIFKLTTYETIYPTFLAYNGEEIIERRRIANQNWNRIKDFIYQVPTNATQIIVNGQNAILLEKMHIIPNNEKVHQDINNYWNNKKGVWFGTSIPAAGSDPDVLVSYPTIMGSMLGMDIINDSYGSSCVHCKKPSRVTADNPYGFVGDFEMASRCMTNSITEMEWIIDNYNSSIWTSATVQTMTEALATKIKSHSYEILLDKYLTEQTFPDVFIFDHGNNDGFNTLEEENQYYQQYGEYSLYTFRGAMNFLIQRILNYNSHAKIVMIGEYTGTDTDKIPAMQLQVSNDWKIPICKLWKLLGWTTTKNIVCKGHWSVFYAGAWVWVDDPTESNTMTVFNAWVPDGLHPHADVSGRAVKHMARMIAKWFVNN